MASQFPTAKHRAVPVLLRRFAQSCINRRLKMDREKAYVLSVFVKQRQRHPHQRQGSVRDWRHGDKTTTTARPDGACPRDLPTIFVQL